MARSLIAVGALQTTWMMGLEAWHWRWIEMFTVFVLLVWPLAVASWRPLLPGGRWVTVALAATLVVLDLAADAWFDVRFPPPVPTRFFLPGWELARVAMLFAASEARGRLSGRVTHTPRASEGRSETPRVRRIDRVIRITSGAMLAIVIALGTFIAVGGSRDQARHADGALVLGADLDPEGHAGPSLIGRAERGAQLYREGLVPLIIVTGGNPRGGRTEGEVARDLLIAAGVPSSAIVVERRARKTEENFACAADLLAAGTSKRILVVTEPWHMPRAMYQGGRYGLELYQAPASSAVWRNVRHASFTLVSESFAYLFEAVRRRYRGTSTCPS